MEIRNQYGKMVEVTEEMQSAFDLYLAARDEYERLIELDDAAFVRYMEGKVKTASAAARGANRSNEQSTKVYAAENAVYRYEIEPDEVWAKFREESA